MQYIPGRFVCRVTGETSFARVFQCVSSGTYFSGWDEVVPNAETARQFRIMKLSTETFQPFTRIEENQGASASDLH